MATVFNPNLQNPEDEKQQGTMLAQGASGTATNVVGGGAAGKAGAAPSAGKPSTSGRFTNIQNYLSANKNTGLAGQVVGRVGNVAQGATQQLNKAGEAFKQASEQGKPAEFTQDPYSNISNAKNVADVSEAFKQAGEQLNTQYKGPMELGDQQNIYANQQQLQGLAGQTSDASGRAALLRNFFAKPTYAAGQNRLDTLILGGKAERPQLQQTKAIAGEFGRGVQKETKEAAQGVQAKTNAAEQTRTKSKEALEASKTQQQKDLEAQIASYNQSEEARAAQRFSAEANKNQLSEGTAKMAQALGISPEQVLQAAGTYDKGQAKLENINPEQAAVLNQIAKMTGGQELALQDKVQQGTYGLNEADLSTGLSPIYALLNSKGAGGYGQLNATLGDTSDLNAAGYDPGQLQRFLNDKGGESGITQVWGGYGRDANEAIGDLNRWENEDRARRKAAAIQNALTNLYKKSGYKG